jgi:hypothetical protein
VKTLVRNSWQAAFYVYAGTMVLVALRLNTPWAYRLFMANVVGLWLCGCALFCVVLWVSALATQEGRNTLAPWAAGGLVALKLFALMTVFLRVTDRLLRVPSH